MAGNLKGNITDKSTREPLTGATVQVVGTALGAVADLDGNYQLNLKPGTYTLQVSYIGYKTEVVEGLTVGQTDIVMNFELDADTEVLGEVTVTARPARTWKANAPCRWNARRPPSPSRTWVPRK